MTRLSMREITRLVSVAFGVLSLCFGSILGFVLLTASTEYGVVKVEPSLEHGQITNVTYVVSAGGRHVRLESDDSPDALKPGDSVPILDYGKGGMVKFGRRFRQECKLAGTLAIAGAAFTVIGLFVLRHRQAASDHTERCSAAVHL